MIALCVNLARKLGIRRTPHALEIFFQWLEVDEVAIPSHETVRLWMQRVGLGRMRKAKKKDDGTWLVDHTNQIGKEKVLTVLRVRSRPRPGVALRHQDVEVLATVPGTEWKREDVAKVYAQLEKRYGTPHCVATDGAVELRKPAENLGRGQGIGRDKGIGNLILPTEPRIVRRSWQVKGPWPCSCWLKTTPTDGTA